MASTINTYFVLPELRQFLTDRGVMNDELSSVLQELEQGPMKLACMVPTKTKGKTKSGRKSPTKSGYNIYQKEYYPKVKAEHPEMSSAEIITHISSTWKARSDEFKAEFKERAAAFNREQEDASSGVSETSDAEDSGAEASSSKKPVIATKKPDIAAKKPAKAKKPAVEKPDKAKAKKPTKAKKPEASAEEEEEAVPSDVEEHDEFNDEFNF